MENVTKFKWDPAPDDFYKARIATLEKENNEMHSKYDEATEYIMQLRMENVKLREDLEDIIEKKGARIAELETALLNVTLGWKGGAV